MVYGLMRIEWVMAWTVLYGNLGFRWFICKGQNIASLIPLTVFWIIWKERNSKAFEDVESSVYKIRIVEFTILILFC